MNKKRKKAFDKYYVDKKDFKIMWRIIPNNEKNPSALAGAGFLGTGIVVPI